MTAPTMTPDSDEEASSRSRRRASPPVVTDVKAAARRAWSRARSVRLAELLRSPWTIGPMGALWAAGIGLGIAVLSMVLVWMATPMSGLGLGESLRIAGLLWTVAHGTPVAIGAVTYSLVPWGLAFVPVLLLAYAGGWSARRVAVADVRDLVILVATASATYGIVMAGVVAASARSDSSAAWPPAVVHAVVLAALAFGWGAWRASRQVIDPVTPSWLGVTARAGGIGAISVLGFGAIAATAALIARVDDAITMAQSLHAGIWGGLGLALLGLAYLPVMIAWSAAYIVGAGFVIGPAVAVSPFIPVTAPSQLPPFPLLSAVPQSASPLAWALPVLAVVAGVLAGIAVARSSRQQSRLTRLLLATSAAAFAGLVLATVSFLADGALGDLRLAHLGPSPSTVGVLSFVLILIGAVPSAVAPAPPARPALAVAVPIDAPAADGTPDEPDGLVQQTEDE